MVSIIDTASNLGYLQIPEHTLIDIEQLKDYPAEKTVIITTAEMKPMKFTEAHSNKDLAEIVCSNSFKSNLHTNACGLLKEELRYLESLLIKIADETAVITIGRGQMILIESKD